MEKEKTIYHQIKDGEKKPEGSEKGYSNMIPLTERSEEEAKEIRRKGQQAMTKKRKERKTFRESMLELLSDEVIAKELVKGIDNDVLKRYAEQHPGCNVQDLLNVATILHGYNGNMKAVEYTRDTIGEKPKDSIEVTADIMTDADRALLDKVNKRLQE